MLAYEQVKVIGNLCWSSNFTTGAFRWWLLACIVSRSKGSSCVLSPCRLNAANHHGLGFLFDGGFFFLYNEIEKLPIIGIVYVDDTDVVLKVDG